METVDMEEFQSPKRGVTFATHARVKVFKDEHDIDPRSTWYSKEEYQRFRYDRAMDAVSMKGRHPDDIEKDGECFWGLENLMVSALRDRILQTRQRITQGVLIEQKCQEMQCRYSPEDLANISRAQSEWSMAVARKKGLFYASEPANDHQDADCRGA
jgi:hypothetical protein